MTEKRAAVGWEVISGMKHMLIAGPAESEHHALILQREPNEVDPETILISKKALNEFIQKLEEPAPLPEEPMDFEDWVAEREKEMFRYDHFKAIGKEEDLVFQTLSFMGRASREMSLALTIAGQTEEIPASYVSLLQEFSKGYHKIQDDIRKLEFEPDEDMSSVEKVVDKATTILKDDKE